jgi:hypothetical protein
MRAHRMAPPDPGFGGRLRELSESSAQEAEACREADQAGFAWRPIPGAEEGQPPYELRPGTGRTGPQELWEAFDAAVAAVNQATAGSEMLVVADAYTQLAQAAGALAEAHETGARPRRPRRRAG